ncbi:MAG: HAMP domain-containing histidine kinase [Lachnospiraceae bacterium]|nr:HAMP domain-containing histidine kinase [Lachnospiraceae bacterium]
MLVAFLVTCTNMLFISVLSDTLNIKLTGNNLGTAARLTFINVIFLSALITGLDYIRRKITVERITKRITEAAKQVVKGDFSVRLTHVNNLSDENFNEIIDCFNKMAEELGSVETLRTDFIANVSHEMKTPLSVIQNYGVLLQTPDLSDKKRMEYAKGVTEGSRRLASMMTNILKLNRLENQQIYPESTEFNLSEQICECLLQFESVWEKEEIEIEADIADDVIVKADAELLGLVWNNLFSNAFKFTDKGGTVSVSLFKKENQAIIKVKDTGCGMTKEVGEHIFEKFYQGDTSHSTSGNGLGLALVKKVIDILQGEIGVESILGQGSTFTIKINCAEMEV